MKQRDVLYLRSAPLDPWLLFNLRLNLVALTGPAVENWGKQLSYLAGFVGPGSVSNPELTDRMRPLLDARICYQIKLYGPCSGPS